VTIRAYEEEEEEDIYLAQTVTYKYTSDKLKNTFQEPGCQKTLRSTMLATNTYNFFFILKLQLQLQFYLNTQRNKYRKK